MVIRIPLPDGLPLRFIRSFASSPLREREFKRQPVKARREAHQLKFRFRKARGGGIYCNGNSLSSSLFSSISFIILLHIPLLAEDKNTFYIIMPSKLALGRASSIE
ncbi:hypothetical protein CBS147346_7812 [Aspergillus niger]|nr:hypothetical protein CBS147346_7812 [Aspergillus niger]